MWKYTISPKIAYICDYCRWEDCSDRLKLDLYRSIIYDSIYKIYRYPYTYVVSCDYGASKCKSVIDISTIPVVIHDNIPINKDLFLNVFMDSYTDKITISINIGTRWSVIPFNIDGDVGRFISDRLGRYGPH